MRLNRRTVFIGLVSAGLAATAGSLFDTAAMAQGAAAPTPQQAPAPAVTAQQPKQIALTAKQVEGVIAAQKDVAAITDKLPDNASDQPDPKVQAQLDGVAKKYGFAGYDDYADVVDTISLVMAGFDPQTKKYVGPEAMVKQQIAAVNADKTMSADDKKAALEDLKAAQTSTPAVQFPANIELVTTYYDKLNAALQDNE